MPNKGLLVATALTALLATAAVAETANGGDGPAPTADAPAPSAKPWHLHLIHQRNPAAFPKDMCVERFARSAARLAYLEARLDLTEAQKPLWDKWAGAMANGRAAERESCLAGLPSGGKPPTALERDDRVEKMLAAKLDTLKTARPALEALYQSLTPEQREVFDRRGWRDGPRRRGGYRHSGPETAPL